MATAISPWVPYEEESGGAVYIFNGNRDGVSRKYSQRLVGSRFSSTSRGFGISISEPRDVNRDNHPAFAVGAYQSGEVVLLKSKTVVTINVTFVTKPKLLRNITSFKINIWMSYEGAPNCLQTSMTLKIDQTYRRATYMGYETNDEFTWFYRLRQMFPVLITPEIYIKKNIQNMVSPLEISVSVQLDGRNCCTSCVINKLRSKTEDVVKLPFLNYEHDVHTSDLGVMLSTDSSPGNRYIIGSTPIIMLNVNIYNRGEPSYQTKVRIFTEILMLASIPPDCIEDSRINSTLDVICDVGDPLTTNKILTLQLDMSMVRYDVKEIKLQAHISSQSNEINLEDNTYAITMYFDVDIDLTFAGKAQESLYSYLHANEEKTLNGIRFQHFYEVQNFGVSPVEEAVLTMKIPTHIWRPDTGEIAVVNINDITGSMDGFELYCSDSRYTEFSFALKKITSTHKMIMKNLSNIATNNIHAKFSINVPSENRTFYINCTNSAVYCIQFDCRLRPFLNSLSVAKFLVTLDLQRSNFPDMMKDKDIIFYVTESSINITQLYVTQTDGHKSDTILVATTFLDPPIVQRISAWLIVISVFLGIVLLMLLILCLIKVDFFKRERIDLEALKAEPDLCIRIV